MTILRASQVIGDWGCTISEAQCLREFEVEGLLSNATKHKGLLEPSVVLKPSKHHSLVFQVAKQEEVLLRLVAS